MKKNKFLIIFLALLAVGLVLTGCQQKTSSSQAQQNLQQVAAEKFEIPLDENLPGAKMDLSRNFVFLLDNSSSMGETIPSGGDKGFSTKMEGAKWAIHEFMKQVPDSNVNLGLVIFGNSDDGIELIPLGSKNRKSFLKAVDDISASTNTPLGEAIKYGVSKLVEQYKKQLGYGEYRLIVVTDGEANGSVSIETAALYAAKYNIPIYTIGFGMSSDHSLKQYSVSYRTANSSADLAKGLEETLGEAASFVPTEFQAIDSTGNKK
jgi:Ca-activated chloride channel homolog